jgi:hypothetical protein
MFSAAYTMSPFGMQLADAQMRVVFPRQNLHPLNPLGTNTARRNNPPMPSFSGARRFHPRGTHLRQSRRPADASWRGEVDELDEFPPLPPGPPSTAVPLSPTRFRQNVVAGSGLAAETKSFAKIIFRRGIIIGGGEPALPNS